MGQLINNITPRGSRMVTTTITILATTIGMATINKVVGLVHTPLHKQQQQSNEGSKFGTPNTYD